MLIKVKSLEHHDFYIRYRLHTENMKNVPAGLQNFYREFSITFRKSSLSTRKTPGVRNEDTHRNSNEGMRAHPVIGFAQKSREHIKFKSRHETCSNGSF